MSNGYNCNNYNHLNASYYQTGPGSGPGHNRSNHTSTNDSTNDTYNYMSAASSDKSPGRPHGRGGGTDAYANHTQQQHQQYTQNFPYDHQQHAHSSSNSSNALYYQDSWPDSFSNYLGSELNRVGGGMGGSITRSPLVGNFSNSNNNVGVNHASDYLSSKSTSAQSAPGYKIMQPAEGSSSSNYSKIYAPYDQHNHHQQQQQQQQHHYQGGHNYQGGHGLGYHHYHNDRSSATAHNGQYDDTATEQQQQQQQQQSDHSSMQRCSHFGDTMHFIDRLSQISLDLRLVPVCRRLHYLHDSLEELNRRLRRRMVTEGNVSLDVEDNLGPNDWPTFRDISLGSLKYSVHFPLEPTATTWPGKHDDELFENSSPLLTLKTEHGVMRVLNIVSPKCRILASRERCPFLVHCEVAETGLEGSDARLYSNHSSDYGNGNGNVNVKMTNHSTTKTDDSTTHLNGSDDKKYEPSQSYHNNSPSEIPSSSIYDESHNMISNDYNERAYHHNTQHHIDEHHSNARNNRLYLRGGEQEGFTYSSMDEAEYYGSSPYDAVREEQLMQLHEHLQTKNLHHPHYGPPQPPPMPFISEENSRPAHTTYSALLDRVYGVPWADACEQIRQTSPYGNIKGWRLASFIMKAGEDIRREALVMQVISKVRDWFEKDIPEHNRPYLKPYTIMCVGSDAGLLECLRDAKSVDEVKKNTDGFTTLREYFERAYGPPSRKWRNVHPPTVHHPPSHLSTHHDFHQQPTNGNQPQYFQHTQHLHPSIHQTIHQMQQQQQRLTSSDPNHNRVDQQGTGNDRSTISFEKAQDNFLRSLVGNSLICYILQIKDRHNANILLDREGHIMHIDFGFVLGDTPKMGKVPIFSERAPFKLTAEFWDVIGGWNFNEGGLGVKFCKMFEEAFYCAAMHVDELVTLVESAVLNLTRNPNEARAVGNGVRNRLRMRGGRDSVQQKTFIMDLVNTALTSWGTSTYDWLQKSMNGYI